MIVNIFYPSSDIITEWQVKPLDYHYQAMKDNSLNSYIYSIYNASDVSKIDRYGISVSVPSDSTSCEIYIHCKAKAGSTIPVFSNPNNSRFVVTLGYADKIIDEVYISKNFIDLNTEVPGTIIDDGSVVWAFKNMLANDWQPLYNYNIGDVKSLFEYPYDKKWICINSGTSGGVEPIWPTTVDTPIADGSIIWTLMNILESSSDLDLPEWQPLYLYVIGDVPQFRGYKTYHPGNWVCISSGTSGNVAPSSWAWKDLTCQVYLNQPHHFHHYHSLPYPVPPQPHEYHLGLPPESDIHRVMHNNSISHLPPPAILTDQQILNEINYIEVTGVLVDPGSYLYVSSLSIEVWNI
jgi:hypothetical protein